SASPPWYGSRHAGRILRAKEEEMRPRRSLEGIVNCKLRGTMAARGNAERGHNHKSPSSKTLFSCCAGPEPAAAMSRPSLGPIYRWPGRSVAAPDRECAGPALLAPGLYPG